MTPSANAPAPPNGFAAPGHDEAWAELWGGTRPSRSALPAGAEVALTAKGLAP
ncbi:hypothetical protein GTY65_26460 [Streptomyces sp. SID8379]|uniref:hypothetical protein n=1 Tax=unclassified Streptomyces TaxID=2593676 RepID=UPI0003A3AC56|nr:MULTISPECIES: hypothetical protein [unclassified Streptomyces]MYW67586.1 hypothetical protein [Streptomyces sp. SID8379]